MITDQMNNLVDVTQFALCFNMPLPTFMSQAAWDMCVAVPPGTSGFEDERLYNVIRSLASHRFTSPMVLTDAASNQIGLQTAGHFITTPDSSHRTMPVSLLAVHQFHEGIRRIVVVLPDESSEGAEDGK